MEKVQDRCDRLNAATGKASEAGFSAVFEAVKADESIPDDADKILASAAAVIALFVSICEGAALPENWLPRRLILAKVEEKVAPALTALYEAEAQHGRA